MSKVRSSFLDILNPPANPWLQEISRRHAQVPSWVRVVRFDNDEIDELVDQVPLPHAGDVPKRKAA